MSKPLWFGFAFVACGWAVLIGTYFLTQRCHKGEQSMSVMGYSNGQGCFDGECKYKATFTDCVNCCTLRCPSFTEECVDLCIEKFDPKDVFRELSQAGLDVGNKQTHDYKKFCRQVVLLKEAQKSANPRTRRIAKLIAREASDKSGLSLLVAAK